MTYHSAQFSAVVFHEDAVFLQQREGQPEAVMPRLHEALTHLQDQDFEIILAAHDRAQASARLAATNLSQAFTRTGKLQICEMERQPEEHAFTPATYWRGLHALGHEEKGSTFAVTGTADGIRSARASGISNVIGFYGSPDVPFGQVHSLRDSLSRDVAPLAGTNHLMENYAALPEVVFHMRPVVQPQWYPMGVLR
jgi:beta-phosphoglucomutase-like phosphatase (HAD superfamily)